MKNALFIYSASLILVVAACQKSASVAEPEPPSYLFSTETNPAKSGANLLQITRDFSQMLAPEGFRFVHDGLDATVLEKVRINIYPERKVYKTALFQFYKEILAEHQFDLVATEPNDGKHWKIVDARAKAAQK